MRDVLLDPIDVLWSAIETQFSMVRRPLTRSAVQPVTQYERDGFLASLEPNSLVPDPLTRQLDLYTRIILKADYLAPFVNTAFRLLEDGAFPDPTLPEHLQCCEVDHFAVVQATLRLPRGKRRLSTEFVYSWGVLMAASA